MAKISLIYLALSFAITAISQNISETDWNNYKNENETEQRLLDFKDTDDVLKLKIEHLNLINRSRKKHKVQPVKLDILASRVANKMATEAAKNNFNGHYNLAGEKPYHRYAFAGGVDHISENAAAEWTNGTFEVSTKTMAEKMAKSHGVFMAEKAPHNGHKLTCIQPDHNFVGLGVYLSSNQFRYYEEYIDRYLTFENVPTEVDKNQLFTLTVAAPEGDYLYYLAAFWENIPKKMSAKQIGKLSSYKDYTETTEKTLTPWELYALKRPGTTTYSIPLKFSKAGLYYITIYLDNKELKSAASISTKGKRQCSGIVIKVRN